ncbi:MAG: DUF6600 domain-containing protein [Vicinamibacterales bacterium]
MGSPRSWLLVTSLLLSLTPWFPPPLHAQEFSAPAHVAYADGGVVLEREGEISDATYGLPFLPGDRLSTRGGRAEVLFPDGTLLHIDDRSTVEMLAESLLRLTDGRLLLVVSGATDPTRALRYQVDTPAASAFTDGPGEYRVSMVPTAAGAQMELSVVRGYATISTDLGAVDLGAGQRSVARDGAPPAYAQAYNSARFDAFDTWSLTRKGERVSHALSSQYLPSDLRGYGSTFDRHGRWEYEASHGYVWYPTVAATWRPYYHGYWASYPRYGWTWIGLDAWGWPTHHYGRWGYKHSRWYWIPGRVWGPAWVEWVGAPAYVGWSPLGYDNRPIFAFGFGSPNVWASWIVLPRSSFGSRHYYAHRYALPYNRIPRGTTFASYRSAPVAVPHRDASVRRAPERSYAVSRVPPAGRAAVSSQVTPAPARGPSAAAGSYAVPRSGAVRRADVPAAATSPRIAAPDARQPSAVRRAYPSNRSPQAAPAPTPTRVYPRTSGNAPGRSTPPGSSPGIVPPPSSGTSRGTARSRSAVRSADSAERNAPPATAPERAGAPASGRSAAQPRASAPPRTSREQGGSSQGSRGTTGAARRRSP